MGYEAGSLAAVQKRNATDNIGPRCFYTYDRDNATEDEEPSPTS